MASKIKRVYWDTCLFLAMLEEPENSDNYICCSNLFREAKENGDALIFTSSLTIAQCPNIKEKEIEEEAIRDFFMTKCLRIVDVHRWITERSRVIRREVARWTNKTKILDLADSLHLATALWVNADKMLTYDKTDLLPLSKKFNTKEGRPLLIDKPSWHGTPRMIP